MTKVLVIAVALLGSSLDALAQTVAQVAPVAPVAHPSQIVAGERMRITPASGRRQIVLVTHADATSITGFANGQQVVVELGAIQRMERSVGDRSRGDAFLRGMGRGFLAGGLGGAALGAATGDPSCTSWDFTCYSREEGALAFGVLLGAVGAFVGGVVGLASPGEQWQRVWAPPRVSAAPRREGAVVGVSVGF